MKYFLSFLFAAISFTAQSAEIPIRRNFVTTNTFMNAPSDGWIAIWNNTAKQWSNGVNTASATNAAQPPSTVLTNLSATGAITNLNANQFSGTTIHSIKDGAVLTNAIIATQLNSQGDTLLTGSSGITANRAMYLDIGKKIQTSANVSSTELEYLDGVTSAIQDQLGSKQAGTFLLTNFALMGITNIVSANANTVITTNAGVLTLTTASGSGGVGPTNANQFGASLTLTIASGALLTNLQVRGIDPLGLTASRALSLNASGDITNGTTTAAELEFVNGVTSAIQTQLGSKQHGTFLLTNFSAMGITNIVSANANTVITTNAGVLTLTTAGTGSPGGNSADVQFNQSGSFAGTNTFTYDRTNNILTAGSFYGSGTGVPILKLQTMMSADNAFAISVRTNFTQSTTNFFEVTVTNASAGQAMVLHSAAAGQLVWTNGAVAGTLGTTNPIVVYRDNALLDWSNTTSETTNLTYTIPAGQLGTDRSLRFSIAGYCTNQTVSRTLRIRVYLGSTTLFDQTSAAIGVLSTNAWNLSGSVTANNSQSAQSLDGAFLLSATTTAGTGYGQINTDEQASISPLIGFGTEDTASAKNLTVTLTWNNTGDAFARRVKSQLILE